MYCHTHKSSIATGSHSEHLPTCRHNTTASLCASPGSCIRGNCEPPPSEHQRLAKPRGKSLPPEERAGSKSSCWKSQLAIAAWCRGHSLISLRLPRFPMYRYLLIKSVFFCNSAGHSFKMFNWDNNISSFDFIYLFIF